MDPIGLVVFSLLLLAVLALLVLLFVWGNRVQRVGAVALLLLLPGCLTRVLRGPAADHYVQAATIATSCEADGYGVGKCTAEDLEAMAEQARCLAAIAKRKRCEAREPEEPGGS